MLKYLVSFCCFFVLCLSLQAQEQQKDTSVSYPQALLDPVSVDSLYHDSLSLPDTIPYDWISYQMKTLITSDDESKTVHLFFVNRIDSIIYVNLNLFGIELGRAVATPDTFVFVNKLEKTYYKGDYSYLAKLLGFPMDFQMMQSLLNGVAFLDFIEPLQPVWQDNKWHLIAPTRTHKLLNLHIMQDVTLNPDNTIAKNEVTELGTLEMLEIQYLDYQMTEYGHRFFNHLIMKLEREEKHIDIELKNLKINVPGPTRITIPEKFKPIE